MVDDLCSPTLPALAIKDVPSNIVIEPDLFLIYGKQRPLTGAINAPLEVGEPLSVVSWQDESVLTHAPAPRAVSDDPIR